MNSKVFILRLTTAMILAMAWCTEVSAQVDAPEDLRRCLEIGLENNYELQIVKNREQQATNNASKLNSGALPTVDLAGGYSTDADNVSSKLQDGSKSRYFDSSNSVNAGVGLDWTIFDGFEIRTNYKRMVELESQSKIATRIAIEDYIANLTAEFYNYIQQQNRLQNLNMAVELSKERLRIVRARYVVGSFSRLDYQQARVDFNVDSADYIKQREVFKSSAIKLNEMMAKDDSNAPVEIRDTLISVNLSLNYDDIKAAMQENNPELLYAKYDTSISQLDRKIITARDYPYAKLSADYGYIQNYYGRGATKSTSRLGINAGVSVGVTLFNSQRRAQRKNADLAIKSAQLNEEDTGLKLNSQLNNLWQAYINNLGLLHLERSSITAAKENYEIAMERYMLGNLSGIEMREAQKSLLDAEDRILTATYNTKVCEISLMLISGEISSYLTK